MTKSYALLVVELILMFGAVFYMLRFYKAPTVEMSVVVATYLAWSLGFAGIVLLPYDIAVALVEDIEMTSLRSLWDTIYWRFPSLTFLV